jgi:xanthine dehydrogenase YagS FAD-binding subunit
MQRTRCYYFYDVATPCNKRHPGAGCSALHGINRIHAILGATDHCIATHPSDMCVALAALEATVHVTGPDGDRTIPFGMFHRLPDEQPERDTTLNQAEIITAVELPPGEDTTHYTYLKLRDRLSYAFALVSVAATLRMNGNRIARARLALGGVAHKPWRDPAAEDLMVGHPATAATFSRVADHLLAGAKGYGHNDFKIPLARKAIVRALEQAAAGTPQSQTDKHIV